MAVRVEKRRGTTRVLVIDIRYTKRDGTKGRYRHDAAVQTRAAATAEERRLLANIAQYGDVHEPKVVLPEKAIEILFADEVATFKAGKAITELKPSTRITYGEILATRLVPRFGALALTAIDHDAVRELDAVLVIEGLSPSRRRNIAAVLRSVLRSAHEAGRLQIVPRLPKLPKVGRTVLRAMTTADVDAILAVSPPAWRLAFGLAAYAGLRAGEVRALRWLDIDMVGRTIAARKGHSRGETAAPKSGHARQIPISSRLLVLLQQEGVHAARELVAQTSHGEQWGEFGLLQAFQRAQARAGIEGWRYHDLRHHFATTLFRQGAAGPAVQQLLGHADLTTTTRYSHLDQVDLAAAIARLG